MGWQDPVTEVFVQKWASVLEEYTVRYGDKVSGWWIDGCYSQYAPSTVIHSRGIVRLSDCCIAHRKRASLDFEVFVLVSVSMLTPLPHRSPLLHSQMQPSVQ
jgi:hypothetical protein